MKTAYRLYPTLVNSFALYQSKASNPQGQVYVSEQQLLDRINRVPVPATEAMQRGTNFETALLKGDEEGVFPAKIIETMRQQLPEKYRTQVFLSCQVKNIEVYGYVDIVARDRAIDIKTTQHYTANKFLLNHQNLYLLGLKQLNIKRLDYLITDFEDVYTESYYLHTYNFQPLFDELVAFTEFLETHREEIIDEKIFR